MRIGRSSIVIASVLTLSAVALTQPAQAVSPSRAESITESRISLAVSPAAVVSVRETITYDFGTNKHHGILRNIPLSRDGDLKPAPLRVTVGAVTADGKPVQFTQERGSELQLRIGDPNKLVTGKHTYVINYSVRNALTTVGGNVRLDWDFVGTGWAIPTNNASATVKGPAEVLSSECLHVVSGVNEPCPTSGTGARANFGPIDLLPNEGMSGIVVFKGSGFTTKP